MNSLLRKILILLLLLIPVFLNTACSKSKSLDVSGPWKSAIHGDVNDMAQRMGHNPKKIKGKIKGKVAPPTPAEPSRVVQGRNGPVVIDRAGSWLGIYYPGQNTIYMPDGFHRWLLRHEVLHALLDKLTEMGIPCFVAGSEQTPGHPMKLIHANGTVINVQDVVMVRWPARALETLKRLPPGGITPQEAWAGPDPWDEVQCVVPVEGPVWLKRENKGFVDWEQRRQLQILIDLEILAALADLMGDDLGPVVNTSF